MSSKNWTIKSFFIVSMGICSTCYVHATTAATLNVTVIGAGSVTSSPAGIDCPGTCSANFTQGTKVKLTALTEPSASFLGWTGTCVGTNLTCNAQMNKDRAVTAEFEPPPPPSPVPQTGALDCLANAGGNYPEIVPCEGTGQDAETQAGVSWPEPRLINNGDGTVTDALTGLVWLQNADCFGRLTWLEGVQAVESLESGFCGLSDGSSLDDWRIPNIKELQSIIAYGNFDSTFAKPQLPPGHPFLNVRLDGYGYWSSTSVTSDSDWVRNLLVNFRTGASITRERVGVEYVWPVRNW